MKWKLTSRQAPRVYFLAFSTDDEVIPLLREFVAKENLRAAHITGIGAFRQAAVAFFELGRKDYWSVQIEEQGRKEGHWGLRRAGLEKVKDGVTSLEEINRVTID